ncbi:MAG: cupin domain-containing protein [Halobacteriota archaeon]
MKATSLNEFPERPNPHGVGARTIYDTQYAQCLHIVLKPGEALKKHITPVDVFFYILEGSGQVEIGDEVREVRQDMVIESPARVPHRLMNLKGEDFRFLVIKVPKPQEATKVL